MLDGGGGDWLALGTEVEYTRWAEKGEAHRIFVGKIWGGRDKSLRPAPRTKFDSLFQSAYADALLAKS